MMPTVVDLICAYGICFGLVNKVEFLRKIKFFDRMLNCSYCTGFHAGWIVWAARHLADCVQPTPTSIFSALCWAFTSAAFCYAADSVLQLVEGWIPRD
jgi:hypothetical protein